MVSNDYIIGVDIGGTNIRIGGVTESGHLVSDPEIHSSRELFQDDSDPVPVLGDAVADYQERHTSGSLRGIAIGLPGTVALDKRSVISCPNLIAFTNRPISDPMEARFHVPVVAEHDVILLMSYDMELLHIGDVSCAVAFYQGTGVGNAIFIHGRFLDGKNGVAGELGHIHVAERDDPCPCGGSGCIELYCSGKALEEIRRRDFPDVTFNDIFLHYDESPSLQNFIDMMAVAFSTEINILNPNVIILGGGVIQTPGFPKDKLIERIHHYTRKPYPECDLEFRDASSDAAAGIRGAGVYMWKKLNHSSAV